MEITKEERDHLINEMRDFVVPDQPSSGVHRPEKSTVKRIGVIFGRPNLLAEIEGSEQWDEIRMKAYWRARLSELPVS